MFWFCKFFFVSLVMNALVSFILNISTLSKSVRPFNPWSGSGYGKHPSGPVVTDGGIPGPSRVSQGTGVISSIRSGPFHTSLGTVSGQWRSMVQHGRSEVILGNLYDIRWTMWSDYLMLARGGCGWFGIDFWFWCMVLEKEELFIVVGSCCLSYCVLEFFVCFFS